MRTNDKSVEVFAILPIRATENPQASSTTNLPGVLLTYGDKCFLVDRQDQIRGIYFQSLHGDQQKLREDILILQLEDKHGVLQAAS